MSLSDTLASTAGGPTSTWGREETEHDIFAGFVGTWTLACKDVPSGQQRQDQLPHMCRMVSHIRSHTAIISSSSAVC